MGRRSYDHRRDNFTLGLSRYSGVDLLLLGLPGNNGEARQTVYARGDGAMGQGQARKGAVDAKRLQAVAGKEQKKMNAIIYTRFSPRRNADKSESCETQEALCREHAKTLGWTVKAVFADKGISGSVADRPGLLSAIAALRRGDVLLVYKRDRLARSVLIAELTKLQVKQAGATIEAVSGDVAGDDDDPTVVLVRQVLEAVAEHARKQIAVRTRDAMLQHQKAGRRMSRFAPYGWAIDPLTACDPETPTKLVRCEPEQQAIRKIRDLAADNLGVVDIYHQLRDFWPRLARSGKWSYNAVTRIVAREKIPIHGTKKK